MNECPHRKEEFRLQTCPSCKGTVQVKVFECSLHGECTIAKQIPGVHVCDGAIAAKKPERVCVQVKVSSQFAATVLDKVDPRSIVPVINVRLDDGREVRADNAHLRPAFIGKRCTVGVDGERWVMM